MTSQGLRAPGDFVQGDLGREEQTTSSVAVRTLCLQELHINNLDRQDAAQLTVPTMMPPGTGIAIPTRTADFS